MSSLRLIVTRQCDDFSAPDSVFRHGMSAHFTGAVAGHSLSVSSGATSFETNAPTRENNFNG